MDNQQAIKDFEARLKRRLKTLPKVVGNEMLNFSLERFKQQAWVSPWPKRKAKTAWGKTPRNGRSILIDTGRMRRSLRVTRADWEAVALGSDDPKAKVHNDGFRGPVRQRVKQHVRKYKPRDRHAIEHATPLKTRTRLKWMKTASGISFVQAHTRTIKQNIPRRRFLGDHPLLVRRLKFVAEMHLTKNI